MIALTVEDIFAKRPDLATATRKQVDYARATTLRKLRKKIETFVKRRVSAKERIPQRALGDRVFSNKVQPGDDELKVWIGTWNISPFSIGKPVQTITGVTAGKRRYPGAFLAQVYTGETKVWIRLHSPHYSKELYPTNYRPGDRGWSALRGRFPVVRAAIPIDATVKTVMEQNQKYFEREFEKIFTHELHYQVNIRSSQ